MKTPQPHTHDVITQTEETFRNKGWQTRVRVCREHGITRREARRDTRACLRRGDVGLADYYRSLRPGPNPVRKVQHTTTVTVTKTFSEQGVCTVTRGEPRTEVWDRTEGGDL